MTSSNQILWSLYVVELSVILIAWPTEFRNHPGFDKTTTPSAPSFRPFKDTNREKGTTGQGCNPERASATKFPSRSQRPSSRSSQELDPIKMSATGAADTRERDMRVRTRESRDEPHEPSRPHTSLGLEWKREGQSGSTSVDVDTSVLSSVRMTSDLSIDDLRASWQRSGAGNKKSTEDPEAMASRMLMTMPKGTRNRFDSKGAKPREGSQSQSTMSAYDASALDEVNRTRREYRAEISCPDGTPVPAYNRKWPHIVLGAKNNEQGNERAMSILSVVRKYDYISQSPGHTKAFSISQRGFVELHKKGLTEFEPLHDLNETMTKYAMATKLPLFAKFKLYKSFHHWDNALRHRKFKVRRMRAEQLLLQARREHWACVQHVMSECVQLTIDVQEGELRPSQTGWNIEQVKDEILRRREVLQEALETSRDRISAFLEKFFSSISNRVSVEKLREVYKHNRQRNTKQAALVASEDMTLLARLYCLCEHILCQTATQLYNKEFLRILHLLENSSTSVLNVDAAMHVAMPQTVQIELPYSDDEESNARNLAELTIVPSGSHVLSVIKQSFHTLYSSLSFSMRPRLLSNLETYIASEVFVPFATRKPEYTSIVTNSVDYVRFYARLERLIEESHKAAIDHCHVSMGHLRLMYAYMEGFSARTDHQRKELIHKYPQEVELYAAWSVALTKLPAQDHDCKAMRLKYRRLKTKMQDKLQLEIVDVRFNMFYDNTCAKITQLRKSGGSFVQNLDADVRTFGDLVKLLNTFKQLDQSLESFVKQLHACLHLREVMLTQYKTTTAFTSNPELKLNLPAISLNLADKMREQKQGAQLRMIQEHDRHVELVKSEVDSITKDTGALIRSIRGPNVQSLSASANLATETLQDARQKLNTLRNRTEVANEVLSMLKLPPLGSNLLEENRQVLDALETLWQAIIEWHAATSEMLNTPIKLLQGIDVNARVSPVLEKVAGMLQKHPDHAISTELKAANRDFLEIWPSIRRLTNKAMKKAHFDVFWRRDSTDIVTYDLDSVTIRQLQADRHLENVQLLTRVHDKAVEEEQMFALMDKLSSSVESMSLNVCREDDHFWLEGLAEMTALIQDDAVLIASIRDSDFRKMVYVELDTLCRRNIDAGKMVSSLRFCQDSWNALRVAHAAKSLAVMNANVYENFESADLKWRKCLTALSMERGGRSIGLVHIDFAHVLRVKEVEELFAQCIEEMIPLSNYLSSQCCRLRFVPMQDAMHITGMFAGPGPTVSEAVLIRAFPNMHAVKVNSNFRPEQVIGAHGEILSLTPSETGPRSWIESVTTFLPLVRNAVQLQVYRGLESVRDGTIFQRSSDLTCQVTILALQISWSNKLTLRPDRSHHAECEAEVKKHMQVLFDMHGSSTQTSVCQWRKWESLVVISYTWRDALDHMASFLQANKSVEMLTQMPCLQVYKYHDETKELHVHYGPYVKMYGHEFLDGSTSSPSLSTSWKYHLFTLSCLKDAACGFISSKDGNSRKETTLKDLARLFGVYCDTIVCNLSQSVERLSQCVQGAMDCDSWLVLSNIDTLSSQAINQLSKAILKCKEDLLAKARAATSEVSTDAGMTLGHSPGVFMTGRRRIDMCLPAELRASFRSHTLTSSLADRRSIAEVHLEALGFERAGSLAGMLDLCYKILELRLSSSMNFCLKLHHLKHIIRSAWEIVQDLQLQSPKGIRSEENLTTSEITTSGGSTLMKSESTASQATSMPFDQEMYALALAFLRHNKRMVKDKEFEHCLIVVNQVFLDAGVDMEKIKDDLIRDIRSRLTLQAETVVADLRQSATPAFVTRCTALMDCLNFDKRPIFLVGAPQTGKSHCIRVVSYALAVDTQNPVKNALPKIAIKFVAPLAYFSSPTGAPNGEDAEVFDYQSVSDLFRYVKELGKWPLKQSFTFDSRWLVLDCPDAQNIDSIVPCIYQQQQELQMQSDDFKPPVLFMETCSLQHASPACLALSRIVYFEDECLGWQQVFTEWTNKVILQIEERTLREIKDLVHAHIPDLVTFVAHECQCEQNVSWTCLMRSFCALMHYHFFLGKEFAMRRTVGFVRAAFAFSIVWSFGAILKEESKPKFDQWFRDRLQKVVTFPYLESEGYLPDLWEIYVSFHTMTLRMFSETMAEFEADEHAMRATEQTLTLPFQNFRMARYLWQMFHTQQEHTLFYAACSGGKTRFLDWMFTIQEDQEKGWSYSQTNMSHHRTTSQLCKWVSKSMEVKPDQIFEKADFHGFFIDDMHVSLQANLQPTAMAELFRSIIERKGTLNKDLFEEQADLENVRFTMFCNMERLTEGSLRVLNHFKVVPIMTDTSSVESIAQTYVQPFANTSLHPAIQAVFNKLPAAMAAVYDWMKTNVISESTDEIFLVWNMDHMFMTMSNLVLLPIWNMDTYDLCFRFIWHEVMRVYLDRFANLSKVLDFRTKVSEIIGECMGAQYRRSLRLAAETETFHLLLPRNRCTASALEWEMYEVNPNDLVSRALEIIHQRDDIPGWVTCIEDFPRHLSHVLRIYRPSNHAQACVLIGPKGCGKLALLQTASALCNYQIFVEKLETPLQFSLQELRKALATRESKLFAFHANGKVLKTAESAHYLLRLMKGHDLEEFEQLGCLSVRFAFTYDLGTAVPVDVNVDPLPPMLLAISQHCTVDWIKGWSDQAIFHATKCRYAQVSKDINFKKDANDGKYPEILFKMHRMVEQAVADELDESMAMVFPAPMLINDLVSAFLHCTHQRRRQSDKLSHELAHAVSAYQSVKDCQLNMQAEHEQLLPIVRGAIKKHLQVREDFLNYSNVATRARRIAEDEETEEIRAILYGDAPGPEIMHEFEIAKNGYLTATKLVADLKTYHLIQLEMFEGYEDLVQMLLASFSTVFADDMDSDFQNLYSLAPVLQQRVNDFDVNAVGLTTVKRLRVFVADVRFTPEKYFSINKAAGVVCNWVRAVERYGRAHQWINPSSQSNKNQSLDRVREMSRNPIMAIDSFEAGVRATKLKEEEAHRVEEDARRRIDVISSQVHQMNLIVNALAPEKVDWNYRLQMLEDSSAMLVGDSMLYAAYVTYLSPFSFPQRCTLLQLLAEALADADIQTTPGFSLESFYLPLDLSVSATYIRTYTSKCLRENCLLIAACPKIPFLIDPFGQGLEVLLSAAGGEYKLMRYSVSNFTDVLTFLEDARKRDVPVLFEHAEELIDDVISALAMNSNLIPKASNRRNMLSVLEPDEVRVDLCQGYSITLSTSKKTYVPPASAFHFMSLCNVTPDEDALQEICLGHVVKYIDEASQMRREQYWRINYDIKDTIRTISKKVSKTLRSEDMIARVQDGSAEDYFRDCRLLTESRSKLQEHALNSQQSLRAIEYFQGIARQCTTVLATFWEICTMSGVNTFGLGILLTALAELTPISDLQHGSHSFKGAIERVTNELLLKMAAITLLALPTETHHLCILLLQSRMKADAGDETLHKFKGALQFLSEAFNNGGLALSSSQVACSRGTGTIKLFSKLGWKVFRDTRPYIGEMYEWVNRSMDLQKELWTQFVLDPQVSLNLPGQKVGDGGHGDVANALVVLSLSPHKLARTLVQLTEMELALVRPQMHEHVRRRAKLSGPVGSLMSVVVGRGVLHWHAVQQVILNLVIQSDSEGDTIDMTKFLVIDSFTSEDELKSICNHAPEFARWIVVKVPVHGKGGWYSKLLRRMTAAVQGTIQERGGGSGLCGSARLTSRIKFCIAVDEEGLGKGSGLLCDSMSAVVENCADPSSLFRAVLADRFFKGQALAHNKMFWRLAVGLCYLHATLVADLQTTASCALQHAPPVQLQSLLDTMSQVAHLHTSSSRQLIDVTRLLVENVFYSPQFQMANAHLADLLDACLSSRLFHDPQQLIIIDKVLGTPDSSVDAGWTALLDYSSTLCNNVSAPWRGAEALCLQMDAQFEQTIRCTLLLERTKLHVNTLPDHSAVMDLAMTLLKLLPKGNDVRLKPTQTQMTFFEECLRSVVIQEFNDIQARITIITQDLNDLLLSCMGRTPFNDYTHTLYQAINENRVVPWWDEFAHSGKCPARWFIEDLKAQNAFFLGKMSMYGICPGGDLKYRSITLLHLFSRPKALLDLYLLAWQHARGKSLSAQVSMAPRRLRFAILSGPPVGEKGTRSFTMDKGLLVTHFVFRCVSYNPDTQCLEKLDHGAHSYGTGAVDCLCLKPLDLDALPFRSTMKARGLYWVPIPVYRRPLCPQARMQGENGDVRAPDQYDKASEWSRRGWAHSRGDGSGDDQELVFVFELYVRSTIAPEILHRLGACAFLHGGIQERASTGYR